VIYSGKKILNKQAVYTVDELRRFAENFSINNILKNNAYQNKPLDFRKAYLLGAYVLYPYSNNLDEIFDLDKEFAEKQGIAALCALHNRETYRHPLAAEQIAGISSAIFDYDIRLSKNGFFEPEIDYAMDNCGMGGDIYRTPNVSTIAALIAAADGIKMCKHGSPGNTDSTGSSDFLQYCGVNLFSNIEVTSKALKEYNFGYTDALNTDFKNIHVQTHRSAHLAHMNDIIGPITNPLHPSLMKRRVLGVNHLIDTATVAAAYKIMNEYGVTRLEQGLFVRGFVDERRNGGIDEISIFPGGSSVAELSGTNITTYDLYAKDFGIKDREYFRVPEGKKEKAEFSMQILSNKISGAPKELILANAAIIQYLARGLLLSEGYLRSSEVLESAEPLINLNKYIRATKGD
jgi:anthranilate phosphoribosyltransferase